MFPFIWSSSMMNSFQNRSGPNFVCFALAGQTRQLSNAGDIKMRWLSTKRKKKKILNFLLTYIKRRKNIIENQCYWCAHRGSGWVFWKGLKRYKGQGSSGLQAQHGPDHCARCVRTNTGCPHWPGLKTIHPDLFIPTKTKSC